MTTRQQIIDKYYTNIALDKDYIDLYYVRRSILAAIEAAMPKFTGKILDVGCGIKPYQELIESCNKNVTSYIGLDFESSIEEEYALGKPELFWKGDVIPMETASVDTVIATELFEHCPDPEKVMKEMLRVLRPNGILFFTVPFLWTLHIVPHDEYRYTPFSLKRHLSNAGFTNIEMQALGGLDASLAQMLAIWYQHRMMKTSYKKYIGKIIQPIIKRLVKQEEKANKRDMFKNGSMITGISGIAYKN